MAGGALLLVARAPLASPSEVRPPATDPRNAPTARAARPVEELYADNDRAAESSIGHGAYVELLGQGLLYSINYEFRWKPLAFRVGYTAFSFLSSPASGVPLSVSAFPGRGPHHLEVGAGITPMWLDDEVLLLLAPQLGHRYQARGGGFLFRAMFMLLGSRNDGEWDVAPFLGLSFGGGK